MQSAAWPLSASAEATRSPWPSSGTNRPGVRRSTAERIARSTMVAVLARRRKVRSGPGAHCYGFLLFSIAVLAGAACVPCYAQIAVERQPSGVSVHNGSETLHLTVCGPDLIHVVAGPGNPLSGSPATPWIANPCQPDHFDFDSDAKTATLKTEKLQVRIDLKTAAL